MAKKYRGQNFGLMPELVPYIVSGRKYVTSRPATEFRQKLVIGGNMNFFTGMRTPKVKRIGTGIVKEKIRWYLNQMPDFLGGDWIFNESPLKGIDWNKFSWIEGFNIYTDFYDYFAKHPKRKLIEEVGLILFVFKFTMARPNLQQIQKNFEPTIEKFLKKEGIIQKGKRIDFEWGSK